MTEEDIARDFLTRVSDKDKELLFTDRVELSGIEKMWIRNMAMREVRNHYGLWHNSELTATWRADTGRLIIDGVDHSHDHPDAVAQRIFEKAKEVYNAGLV